MVLSRKFKTNNPVGKKYIVTTGGKISWTSVLKKRLDPLHI